MCIYIYCTVSHLTNKYMTMCTGSNDYTLRSTGALMAHHIGYIATVRVKNPNSLRGGVSSQR
jgi:hypothetical protein